MNKDDEEKRKFCKEVAMKEMSEFLMERINTMIYPKRLKKLEIILDEVR